MASPTVNTVRYSALFFGVVYGWYHRRTLLAEQKVHKIEAAAHDREHLIHQAKEAWRKKQEEALKPKTENTLITDPEDPRFDLEKLVASWEATA